MAKDKESFEDDFDSPEPAPEEAVEEVAPTEPVEVGVSDGPTFKRGDDGKLEAE
jgi:hypothetical protein